MGRRHLWGAEWYPAGKEEDTQPRVEEDWVLSGIAQGAQNWRLKPGFHIQRLPRTAQSYSLWQECLQLLEVFQGD